MAWGARDVMEQRIEFVVKAWQAGSNLSELCREYAVSRPTGYRWLKRYEEVGSVRGLSEKSRRPQHSPGRTAREMEDRVVELRQRYGWGAKKLVVLLAREGIGLKVVTVNRILKRRGLLVPEECVRPATQRFEREAPNQLWQMGFQRAVASGGRLVLPAHPPGRSQPLPGGLAWAEGNRRRGRGRGVVKDL